MSMIRTLEGRLRVKNPNDDKFAVDFEHLSNLKKELGLPVGFKTETEKKEEARAKLAGWDPVSRRPIKTK